MEFIDIKSPLYHACGARVYRILPETESDQVRVTNTGQTLTETLLNIDRALGGNTSMRFCPNIASRNQLAGILPGDRVYVLDASADPDVTEEGRGAFYIFLPTMQWRMIGEFATQDMKDYVKEAGGLTVGSDNTISISCGSGLALAAGRIVNAAPVFNTEKVLTTSGSWIAPLSTWYHVKLIGGGCGGLGSLKDLTNRYQELGAEGGDSGGCEEFIRFYEKGELVSYAIGAGGIGQILVGSNTVPESLYGGVTTFDGVTTKTSWQPGNNCFKGERNRSNSDYHVGASGGGAGAGQASNTQTYANGQKPGAGGGVYVTTPPSTYRLAGNGSAGAVYIRYYDPALEPGYSEPAEPEEPQEEEE